MEQGNPLTGEPVTTTTGTGHGDLPHYYVQTTESLILEELRAIRVLLEKANAPRKLEVDVGGMIQKYVRELPRTPKREPEHPVACCNAACQYPNCDCKPTP